MPGGMINSVHLCRSGIWKSVIYGYIGIAENGYTGIAENGYIGIAEVYRHH